jgi:AcrR family transcriptional regulator
MPRLPRAKALILSAAREIVERDGAGALTFEELSRVSGVTRGGITYHFPTKDLLLQGLLEHDMAQWKESEAACTPSDLACPRQCELIGFIRSHTSEDDSRRRFVAGMLSAAVHQPELLNGCREEIRERYLGADWNDAALRAHVLRLAAVGLFWDEIFQFQSMPPQVRQRFTDLLERLAREWVVDPTTTTDNNQQ